MSFSFPNIFLFQNCLLLFLFYFLFFYIFFQNCFCRFYFFNIEMIENLALYFFLLKHCGLLQCFPTCFFFSFFYDFFLELSLSILFFSYWAGWQFSFVVFSLKHCGLLQYSPWFFFVMIFFKIIFIDFIISNIELVENYNFRILYETL